MTGRKSIVAVAVVVSVLGAMALRFAVAAEPPPLGTADEAKAILTRAVAALKANEAAALKAFNDEHNKQFRERDLFIYCFNVSDGIMTAYVSPALLGTDIRELKLPDDPIGQRAYDTVAKAPEGEIVSFEYKLNKPGTKQPAVKQSLEVRIGGQACGISFFE